MEVDPGPKSEGAVVDEVVAVDAVGAEVEGGPNGDPANPLLGP